MLQFQFEELIQNQSEIPKKNKNLSVEILMKDVYFGIFEKQGLENR